MRKGKLILASVLALTAAACGQLNQGKQAPAETGGAAAPAEAGAPADAAATPDGKPAEGDAADKPEADKPS